MRSLSCNLSYNTIRYLQKFNTGANLLKEALSFLPLLDFFYQHFFRVKHELTYACFRRSDLSGRFFWIRDISLYISLYISFRREWASLNRIAADKSHSVIMALDSVTKTVEIWWISHEIYTFTESFLFFCLFLCDSEYSKFLNVFLQTDPTTRGGGNFHVNLYGTCRFSGYHFSA